MRTSRWFHSLMLTWAVLVSGTVPEAIPPTGMGYQQVFVTQLVYLDVLSVAVIYVPPGHAK